MSATADRRAVWMLVAMSAATFVITSSGSATAPFMPAIAGDLGTDISAIAHLFSVQALTWGSSALVFGMLSHRLNKRTTLVVSVFTMGVIRMLFAMSQSYTAAFTWQLLSGICGGAFSANGAHLWPGRPWRWPCSMRRPMPPALP